MEQLAYLAITIVSTSYLVTYLANKSLTQRVTTQEESLNRIRELVIQVTRQQTSTEEIIRSLDNLVVRQHFLCNSLTGKITKANNKALRAHQILHNLQILVQERLRKDEKIDTYIQQNFQHQGEFIGIIKAFITACQSNDEENNQELNQVAAQVNQLPNEVSIEEVLTQHPVTPTSPTSSTSSSEPEVPVLPVRTFITPRSFTFEESSSSSE